jgi:hypothetical protein
VWGVRRRQAGAPSRTLQPLDGVPTVRPNGRAGQSEGVRDPVQIEGAGFGRVSGEGTLASSENPTASLLRISDDGVEWRKWRAKRSDG